MSFTSGFANPLQSHTLTRLTTVNEGNGGRWSAAVQNDTQQSEWTGWPLNTQFLGIHISPIVCPASMTFTI